MQHLDGRDAERQRERAVAVVRKEPVVAGAQVAGESEQQRFVPRAGDLEERAVLLAQRDLAVVAETRHQRLAQIVDRLDDQRVACGIGGIDRVDH